MITTNLHDTFKFKQPREIACLRFITNYTSAVVYHQTERAYKLYGKLYLIQKPTTSSISRYGHSLYTIVCHATPQFTSSSLLRTRSMPACLLHARPVDIGSSTCPELRNPKSRAVAVHLANFYTRKQETVLVFRRHCATV